MTNAPSRAAGANHRQRRVLVTVHSRVNRIWSSGGGGELSWNFQTRSDVFIEEWHEARRVIDGEHSAMNLRNCVPQAVRVDV